MQLDTRYDPSEVEDKWYKHWEEKGYFHSEPDNREPFVIPMPPPNVTGMLHMGHMLNNTIQDVLTRRARMQGKNACWVPGTDHASIATEAKVVKMLAEKGIQKKDISREEFLGHAWDWKEKYGGIILGQLKKIGASCDWQRTRFTMEESLTNGVIESFIKLYREGLIYRGTKMINWDPAGKTTLSDEEVIHKEVTSNLYYIRYKLADGETVNGNPYMVVATTRPETIMGDTALCVHPDDERYKHLVGKKAFVPLINRELSIITDDYIDIEFGTGCLKVTPAHDINDYNIGQKHNLETIDVFDEEGKINPSVGIYAGMDRFAVRKKIAYDLEEAGLIEKTEQIKNSVGHSERTDAVIEPRISTQWFVDMKKFLEINPHVIDSVMNDEIKFHPPKFKNVYKHWLDNIKDWNISRQLWWGQRIPAWYDGSGNFVVAENHEKALIQYNINFPGSKVETLSQDEDVLDTWFSSWLWPISIFDGFDSQGNNPDFKYYYPANDLVTGPDIIFFWVARMIMSGYHFAGKKPFSNVYFTGIVRDKKRRKMSKQLGNSPDPLDLINKHGADGTRMGLLLSAPAGNDILYDETLIEQGRNFCNKIWNAYRLIKGWEQKPESAFDTSSIASDNLADKWFDSKFKIAVNEIEKHFDSYRLSDALMTAYKLVWDDFCSWYLEMIKPAYGEPANESTVKQAEANFERILALLHPFMPFITEELYHDLHNGNPPKALIVSAYPEPFDEIKIYDEKPLQIISELRNIRTSKGVSPKESLALIINATDKNIYEPFISIIKKLGNISEITFSADKPANAISALIGTDEIYVPLNLEINKEDEIKRISEELKYLEGFLKSVSVKLSNEKFVSNAKEDVIANERKKQADAEEKINNLKKALQNL
ncbi:MAG: valine--tRNA ligase [Bacteroidia bacterium]|nr:valine--tRNA ligase [Bacteroidia bacterium]